MQKRPAVSSSAPRNQFGPECAPRRAATRSPSARPLLLIIANRPRRFSPHGPTRVTERERNRFALRARNFLIPRRRRQQQPVLLIFRDAPLGRGVLWRSAAGGGGGPQTGRRPGWEWRSIARGDTGSRNQQIKTKNRPLGRRCGCWSAVPLCSPSPAAAAVALSEPPPPQRKNACVCVCE